MNLISKKYCLICEKQVISICSIEDRKNCINYSKEKHQELIQRKTQEHENSNAIVFNRRNKPLP
jgi:hypothetical protein